MTHQIRNCRKRLHYPKCSSTIRRLVHETDSNFVVICGRENYKKINHPMPVRLIRHSSATVVEMEYTRNLKFLREIYADSSSVGSTITDKIPIPPLHISLLFILSFTACILSVLYVEKKRLFKAHYLVSTPYIIIQFYEKGVINEVLHI